MKQNNSINNNNTKRIATSKYTINCQNRLVIGRAYLLQNRKASHNTNTHCVFTHDSFCSLFVGSSKPRALIKTKLFKYYRLCYCLKRVKKWI